MNPHRASASKVAELLACQYWARPDVRMTKDAQGAFAKTGSAIDDLTVAYLAGNTPNVVDASLKNAANRWEVEALWDRTRAWLDKQPPGRWDTQLWLVYDAGADSVRVSSREEAFTRARGPMEISCVIDLARESTEDAAELWDVKTGNARWVHNEQWLTLALAVRRHFRTRFVRGGYLFLEPEGVRPIDVPAAGDLLDDHALKLAAALRAVPNAEPKPSDACRFCRVSYCKPGEQFRESRGWKPRTASP